MHKLLYGPQIVVEVTAHNNLVTGVKLLPHSEPGLVWNVSSQTDSKKIEKQITVWFKSYVEGKSAPLPEFDFPIFAPFTLKVLDFISGIPFGKTYSYQECATQCGSPRVARAAGSACGVNPFALFIPCHRIIASNGKLGGFSYDLVVKKSLLEFETL